MTAPKDKIRLLMELRVCFERYAGIPQETRLLFSAFLDDPQLAVDGLINHTVRRLARGLNARDMAPETPPDRRFDRLSKFIVSTLPIREGTKFQRWREDLRRDASPFETAALTKLGVQLRTGAFDATDFPEFIWDTFFAATLSPSQIEKVRTARYRTLSTSWRTMHRTGLFGGPLAAYPRLDTQGYDLVLTQTPYPALPSPGTRLVVRYHDAIPMFQTHTIPTPSFHRKSHYRALRANAKHAYFACTSQSARSDLLKMFPALEAQSCVVHDVVSNAYFEEPPNPDGVVETIRSCVERKTQPKFRSSAVKARFYEEALEAKPLRYLLMVSSIEPRKNHVRLVRAWERLRRRGNPDLKLVIVGALGWEYDPIIESFVTPQQRGMLFHLSGVPTNDLRTLYAGAECTICPSIAEGFDLSGIEAMLCGGVVAASDIAVHTEVYGDAAVYFDRYSPESMAETIARVIGPEHREFRSGLREKGLKLSQRYTSSSITPQWLELFGKLARDRRPALRG